MKNKYICDENVMAIRLYRYICIYYGMLNMVNCGRG